MHKSTVMKMSNASFFAKIKGSLLSYRRVFTVEARLIINETNQNVFENPKTKDYRVFLKLAKEAFQRQEFKEALSNIDQCLAVLKETPNSINNFDRARIYEFAAKVYKHNYQLYDSILLFKESLSILKKDLGEDNIFAASIIYDLADSYFENDMPKEAVFYYTKYLKLKEIKKLDNRELRIFVLKRIGIAYSSILGPKKSISLLKKCLRLNKQYFGEPNAFFFDILFSIGNAYFNSYKKDKAAKYYKKCFDLLRNTCLKKQIKKEYAYNLLINYYTATKMPEKCFNTTKRAIKYLKSLKKDMSLSIAYKYKDLADSCKDKNDIEKWFYYSSKYLTILKKNTGLKHPRFLESLLDYIDALNTNNFGGRALEILKNLPKELKIILKSNKWIRARYKQVKGLTYSHLQMAKKASKKLKEAKKLILELLGKHHPYYISCCQVIGFNYFVKGNSTKALAILKKAFFGILKYFSYYSLNSGILLYFIAFVYLNKGEFDHSLEYFKRELHVLSQLDLESSYIIKATYLHIAQIYATQRKFKLFFYYLWKSLDVEFTKNISKNHYYSILYDTHANYFFCIGNYRAAKSAHIKLLKYFLSSDSYNNSLAISIISNIAKCEIKLRNYSILNRYYRMCKDLNEESVKEGQINPINKNVPKILLIKAHFYYHHLEKYEECLNTLKIILNVMERIDKKIIRIILKYII